MPHHSYVVTGGGRGVGRAICERLLSDGHAVVVVDVNDEAGSWTGRSEHRDAVAVVAGSASDAAVAREAVEAADRFAPLSGWVNNAAVFDDLTIESAEPAEIMARIDANLAPAVVGSTVAAQAWIARGHPGAIINVSSHQAQRAVRGAMAYATAKAAVEGLTRTLAVDLGPHQIRANAVALGSITTQRYVTYLADQPPHRRTDVVAQMARIHPLGRVGTPDEVAATVAFLLGDDGRAFTGSAVPMDLGWTAR
jgi:NAD(P)-dependent dehydrogenase (short-subunit alcohol dehydrogenase family)